MKSRKRIAKLTPKENHAWEFASCFYLDEGKTDLQRDRWLGEAIKLLTQGNFHFALSDM